MNAPDLFAALNSAQDLLMRVACQESDTLNENLRATLRHEALAACAVLHTNLPRPARLARKAVAS